MHKMTVIECDCANAINLDCVVNAVYTVQCTLYMMYCNHFPLTNKKSYRCKQNISGYVYLLSCKHNFMVFYLMVASVIFCFASFLGGRGIFERDL